MVGKLSILINHERKSGFLIEQNKTKNFDQTLQKYKPGPVINVWCRERHTLYYSERLLQRVQVFASWRDKSKEGSGEQEMALIPPNN